jgi:hypothetical protein
MKTESNGWPASEHHVHVHRRDGGSAFVQDPSEGNPYARDDLAEALAESFVASATSGEHTEQALDDFVDEELGGPFLEQSGAMDLPPEGFQHLETALRHELTAEPDQLGREPPRARRNRTAGVA